MDLTLKYSKTSKGSKAVLTKPRYLSSIAMQILSNIDGRTPADAIQEKLQLKGDKFTQAFKHLLEDAYIQEVQDFGPTVFDLNSAIEVSEISSDDFFQLELPAEQFPPTVLRVEAEERARVYQEDQKRKEDLAREQVEAERRLLSVTDILAKSGENSDIEELAGPGVSPITTPLSTSITSQVTNVEKELGSIVEPVSTQFTASNYPAQSTHIVTLPPLTSGSTVSDKTVSNSVVATDRFPPTPLHPAQLTEGIVIKPDPAPSGAMSKAVESERATAERIRQENEEAQARLKTEEKARKDEERKAQKEAEKTRKQAEQHARKEAKRLAREADELKARALAEQRAKEKAESAARAREAAILREKEIAALKAERAHEAAAKAAAELKIQEERRQRRELLARENAAKKANAKRNADERAAAKAEIWKARRTALLDYSSDYVQKFSRLIRPLLIGTTLVIVGLIAILPFVSLAMWAEPVEHAFASSIGEPVDSKDMRIGFWPHPHLTLEEVTAGTLSDVTAQSVRFFPDISTMLSGRKQIRALEIERLSTNHEHLARPFNWFTSTIQQNKYLISSIHLKDVAIVSPVLAIPVFTAHIQLTDAGELKTVQLAADNLVANLEPTNDGLGVEVQANNWKIPFGVPFTFEQLKANGTATRGQLSMTTLEGNLYGGNIKGSMTLDWTQGWRLASHLVVSELSLERATSTAADTSELKGTLFTTIDITGDAATLQGLLSQPKANARFEAENGEFRGIDLSRAAAGKEQVGGTTRFTQLSGNWYWQEGMHQLSKLNLIAAGLKANGDLAVTSGRKLSGKVQTSLELGPRQMQGRFFVTGNLDSPRLTR